MSLSFHLPSVCSHSVVPCPVHLTLLSDSRAWTARTAVPQARSTSPLCTGCPTTSWTSATATVPDDQRTGVWQRFGVAVLQVARAAPFFFPVLQWCGAAAFQAVPLVLRQFFFSSCIFVSCRSTSFVQQCLDHHALECPLRPAMAARRRLTPACPALRRPASACRPRQALACRLLRTTGLIRPRPTTGLIRLRHTGDVDCQLTTPVYAFRPVFSISTSFFHSSFFLP